MREVDELRRHAKILQVALDGLVAAAEALAAALERPDRGRPIDPVMMSQIDAHSEQLLTERETAEFLGLSRGTLSNWRASQQEGLPYVKIGRTVRYRLRDVEALIKASKNQPPR